MIKLALSFFKRACLLVVLFFIFLFLLLMFGAKLFPFWDQQIVNLGLIAFLALSLGLGLALVQEWQARRYQRQIALFIAKLKRIQAEDNMGGHILLAPSDPMAPLAAALNETQHVSRLRLKQLQQQASTLAALVDNMPLGVMRIKPDHTLVEMNAQASQLLNITQPKPGESYDNVLKNHALVAMLNRALTEQKNSRKTVQVDRVKLDVSVVYYQLRPRHYEALVLLYDMTEISQLQAMQADFVTNASHELRTPLTAIAGFTETLLSGAQEDSALRAEFLHIIQDESQRLLALTQDILTLAKSPMQERHLALVAIKPLVDEVLTSHKDMLAEQKISVDIQVPSDLALVQDKSDLKRLLINLIGNAIKYNRLGGRVTIKADHTEKVDTLIIEDTGRGIPSDEQGRIFERFYRIDKSRNQRIPGTGLGLAIVHDLVKELGGQVLLDSQVGVGTKVTIQLPTTVIKDIRNGED